jgi:protein-S-isoprenylcysteine O-methyltransferase Ste14
MADFQRKERTMKWAGLYLVGFIVLIGGGLAALYKLGLLHNVSTSWIVIGVVILLGIGIMAAVANSGMKENISIDR